MLWSRNSGAMRVNDVSSLKPLHADDLLSSEMFTFDLRLKTDVLRKKDNDDFIMRSRKTTSIQSSS